MGLKCEYMKLSLPFNDKVVLVLLQNNYTSLSKIYVKDLPAGSADGASRCSAVLVFNIMCFFHRERMIRWITFHMG